MNPRSPLESDREKNELENELDRAGESVGRQESIRNVRFGARGEPERAEMLLGWMPGVDLLVSETRVEINAANY